MHDSGKEELVKVLTKSCVLFELYQSHDDKL